MEIASKTRGSLKMMLLGALVIGSLPLFAGEWEDNLKEAARLNQKGDLKGAEEVLLRTLYTAEAFGESDPRLAYTLDYLGTLNMQMNEVDKAEPIFERAVRAFKASRGPDAPETLESMGRLAESYDAAQLYSRSEPIYRALVASGRGDALQQSVELNSLAVSIDAQNRQDEALVLYQKALLLRQQSRGPDAAELPEILNNIARVYYMKHKYAKAEPLYIHAIAIDEKNLAAGDPQMADDYRRLAALYKKSGQKIKADAYEAKAVAVENAAKAQPTSSPSP
jgi:tetratricopeptide (TPR) repeat protein